MKGDRRKKRSTSAKQGGLVQIKATLKDVHPSVWRRICIPDDATLADLHDVLQVALGWTNSHLHQFRVGERRYGPRGPQYADLDLLEDMENEHTVRLVSLVAPGTKFSYDFGDGWEHEIEVEKVVPATPDAVSLRCIAGARACPPEDCGGSPGYEDLLKAIRDPSHERHDELLDWLGGPFDPERFELAEVNRELAAIGC